MRPFGRKKPTQTIRPLGHLSVTSPHAAGFARIGTVERFGTQPNSSDKIIQDVRVGCRHEYIAHANLPSLLACPKCFGRSLAIGMPVALRQQRHQGGHIVSGKDPNAVHQFICGKLTSRASNQKIRRSRTIIVILMAHAGIEQPFGLLERFGQIAKPVVGQGAENI